MNDERRTSFEDELLEQALEHRRVAEPRPGLEERVLARLETAREPRWGFFFKLAVAVPAVLAIAAALYMFRSPVTPPPLEVTPPRIVQAEPPAATDPEDTSTRVAEPVLPTPTPAFEKREEPEVVPQETIAASRSPMFPSPRALSPQEALLVRFVRNARPETLQAASGSPPRKPLQIEELSMQPLHVEPLPAKDPLTAS